MSFCLEDIHPTEFARWYPGMELDYPSSLEENAPFLSSVTIFGRNVCGLGEGHYVREAHRQTLQGRGDVLMLSSKC